MEGDDDDDGDHVPASKQPEAEASKGKGKGKGKGKDKDAGQGKGKGKGKAGEPAKEQPQPKPRPTGKDTAAGNIDAGTQDLPAKKVKPRGQPTGQFHPTPCPECSRWREACEQDVRGGACVGCKMRKVKCTYTLPSVALAKKKSKPVIGSEDSLTSDAGDAGTIYVSRPKPKPKREAAKKAAKAITDHEMADATDAGEKVGKPVRKRATRRATLPKETEELVDIVKSK